MCKVPVVDFGACLTSLKWTSPVHDCVLCLYKKDKVKIILKIHTCVNQLDISSTNKVGIEKSCFCFFVCVTIK